MLFAANKHRYGASVHLTSGYPTNQELARRIWNWTNRVDKRKRLPCRIQAPGSGIFESAALVSEDIDDESV